MEQTYLFYDLETTGLSKAFDQVLQFAAIRTDLNLNEIERHQFLVRANPDVIMSPYALITHRIPLTPHPEALTEYDAIQKIHRLVNTPGTISLGYNTLGFDDEFLRFSFFRHLLPPYTHQYSNQCYRMDLYPMTVMYWLFKRDIIQWPNLAKPRLKLELLNEANKLAKGPAHDALVDVEATVALARLFQKDEGMWKYLSETFVKSTDIDRAARLPKLWGQYPEALWVEGSCGAANAFQYPVIGLGQHKKYKNQTLWLRLDDERLMQTKPDNIAETTFALRKKWGEPGFLLPMKERYQQSLSQERLHQIEVNKKWLLSHPEILEAITAHHVNYIYPDIENIDSQAALYQNGFLSQADQKLCSDFHNASVSEKLNLLERLSDQTTQTVAIRFLGHYHFEALPAQYQAEYQAYLAKVWSAEPDDALMGYQGRVKLQLPTVLAEIKTLLAEKTLDKQQVSLLEDYQIFLNETLKRQAQEKGSLL